MRAFWSVIAGLVVCSAVILLLGHDAPDLGWRGDGAARAPVPVTAADPTRVGAEVTTPAPPDPVPPGALPAPPGTVRAVTEPTPTPDGRVLQTVVGADGRTHIVDWSGTTPRDLMHPPRRSRRRAPAVEDAEAPDGTGTPDDPFTISWGLLDRARLTYAPRRGQEEIPPELAALDGRSVEIAGYILAPWASDEITELLFMRYEWDGCCIGVPPTAYSAIEVTLETPSRRRDFLQTPVATITGRLRIDPQVERDWLLSLYLIEDGRLRVDR